MVDMKSGRFALGLLAGLVVLGMLPCSAASGSGEPFNTGITRDEFDQNVEDVRLAKGEVEWMHNGQKIGDGTPIEEVLNGLYDAVARGYTRLRGSKVDGWQQDQVIIYAFRSGQGSEDVNDENVRRFSGVMRDIIETALTPANMNWLVIHEYVHEIAATGVVPDVTQVANNVFKRFSKFDLGSYESDEELRLGTISDVSKYIAAFGLDVFLLFELCVYENQKHGAPATVSVSVKDSVPASISSEISCGGTKRSVTHAMDQVVILRDAAAITLSKGATKGDAYAIFYMGDAKRLEKLILQVSENVEFAISPRLGGEIRPEFPDLIVDSPRMVLTEPDASVVKFNSLRPVQRLMVFSAFCKFSIGQRTYNGGIWLVTGLNGILPYTAENLNSVVVGEIDRPLARTTHENLLKTAVKEKGEQIEMLKKQLNEREGALVSWQEDLGNTVEKVRDFFRELIFKVERPEEELHEDYRAIFTTRQKTLDWLTDLYVKQFGKEQWSKWQAAHKLNTYFPTYFDKNHLEWTGLAKY
ncbi:MAG: hypothetical protein LBF56_03355 [Holosporales bacterium]|nr:hypothetical protein [Holosporales bacterium]